MTALFVNTFCQDYCSFVRLQDQSKLTSEVKRHLKTMLKLDIKTSYNLKSWCSCPVQQDKCNIYPYVWKVLAWSISVRVLMLRKSHYNPEIFQTALRSAAESYHVISSVRSVPRNLKPTSWSPELCCFWIQDESKTWWVHQFVCVISLQLDWVLHKTLTHISLIKTFSLCVTRKEKRPL